MKRGFSNNLHVIYERSNKMRIRIISNEKKLRKKAYFLLTQCDYVGILCNVPRRANLAKKNLKKVVDIRRNLSYSNKVASSSNDNFKKLFQKKF